MSAPKNTTENIPKIEMVSEENFVNIFVRNLEFVYQDREQSSHSFYAEPNSISIVSFAQNGKNIDFEKDKKQSDSMEDVEKLTEQDQLEFHKEEIDNVEKKIEENNPSVIFQEYKLEVTYLNNSLQENELKSNFKLMEFEHNVNLNHNYVIPIRTQDESDLVDFLGNSIIFTLYKVIYNFENSNSSIINTENIIIGYGKIDSFYIFKDKKLHKARSIDLELLDYEKQEAEGEFPMCLTKIILNYNISTEESSFFDNFFENSNSLQITIESIINCPEFWKISDTKVQLAFFYPSNCKLNKAIYLDLMKNHLSELNDQDQFKKLYNLLYNTEMEFLSVQHSLDKIYDMINIIEDIIHTDAIYKNFMSEQTNIFFHNFINFDWKFMIEIYEEKLDIAPKHYVGFIDLSSFCYNGVNEGRFCVSFQPYNSDEVFKKCNQQIHAFEIKPKPSELPSKKDVSSGKSRFETNPKELPSKKIVSSTKSKELNIQSSPEPIKNILSNNSGNPVYIIIKFEIEKPYKKDFDDDELLNCVNRNLPPHKILTNMEKTTSDTLSNFFKEIEHLVIHIKKSKLNDNEINENKLNELHKNLKKQITEQISIIYNNKQKTEKNFEFKNLMSDVFNELIEKIYNHINRIEFSDNHNQNNTTSWIGDLKHKEDLVLMAQEAFELGFQNWCNKIYKQNIEKFIDSEEPIIDYIIHQNYVYDFTKSKELIDKVLIKNKSSWFGMLFLSYHLYLEKKLYDFENVLIKMIRLHPEYLEGWILLLAFYKMENNRGGIRYTSMMHKHFTQKSMITFIHEKDELIWNIETKDKPYLNYIVFFVKAGLYEFAKLIFDLNLEEYEKTDYDYLKCIIDIFVKNYPNALQIIDQYLIKEFDQHDNSIKLQYRSLKGYCLSRMKNETKSIKEFKIAYHTPPHNFFKTLDCLKCGFYNLRCNEFQDAKTYFISAVMTKPTFFGYYGLGICCYRCGDLNDSEKCFIEANLIDKSYGDVWVYLAMINFQLDRYNDAVFCFSEAKQCTIEDMNTMHELIDMMNEI